MKDESYNWLTPSVITFACIAGYIATLTAGFLADDFVIMYNINKGLIVETGTGGAFFRPLVWLTFSINWFIFNHEPIGFHIFNLALHIVASLGVAACASMLFRYNTAGLVAGLIFALHPAHPEAVVWIAGRYDVMTGALLAWSLYFHLKTRRIDVMKLPLYRLISLVLFGLACLSKESAFIFPVAMIIAELIPSQNRRIKTAVTRALPFIILAVVIFIIRWTRLGGIGGGDYLVSGAGEDVSSNVIYNLFIQPFYILIFPFNKPLFEPQSMLSRFIVGLVLFIPLLSLLIGGRWRLAFFCVLSIIACSLPTANVGIYEETLRNSRFLYITSIFYSLLIAGLLCRIEWKAQFRKYAGIVVICYMLIMAFCLSLNNSAWHDAGALVRGAMESSDWIVSTHYGEWGVKRHRIMAVGIPRTVLGALAFDWGFPEMLRLRHPDEMKDVEIEVIYSGVQTTEHIAQIETARMEGADIWYFNEDDMEFVEGTTVPIPDSLIHPPG